MDFQITFHMCGYPEEVAAMVANQLVRDVMGGLASELGLSLAGIDDVTIAYDYDSALAELDRGFTASRPLSRTSDEFAIGVAMCPLVKRDAKVLSHIVLSAVLVPLIDVPSGGVSGKYFIAHELAHAHEHYFREKYLPGTLLQQPIFGAADIFLYDTADACWSEFAACYFSALAGPECGRLLEKTLVAALRGAKESILQAKREWLNDGDFVKVWVKIASIVAKLLKNVSYVMGHTAGLDKPFEEAANEAWLLMEENDWLFPRFEELFAALAEMMNTFEQWKGLEAYDPLKKVVRDVLEDCGITMQQTPSGSLYIWVNEGKLPL